MIVLLSLPPTDRNVVTAATVEAALNEWHVATGEARLAMAAWARDPSAENRTRLEAARARAASAHERYLAAYAALHKGENADG